MNSPLLWIILTFGIAVLFTYVHLYQTSDLGSLVRPIPLKLWIPSMLLTISSFVYMSTQWIWHLEFHETAFGMFGLFFSGAVLWAPMTADAVHRQEKTYTVLICLWLAAAGSIGLFVASFDHVDDPWLVVASGWFMIHHVFVDAIFWWIRWHFFHEKTAIFHLDTEEKTAMYNDMEFI